jgi:hypothetical protein
VSKFYKYFAFVLIFVMCFSLIYIPQKSRAQSSDGKYPPNVKLVAAVDAIGNTTTGFPDVNPILFVYISPISGMDANTYANANENFHYVVNIYDTTKDPHIPIENRYYHDLSDNVLNLNWGKSKGIKWDHTYEVIVDLRSKMPTGTDGSYTTIGSVRKPISIGPSSAIGHGGATTDGSSCAIQNLKWYPSTEAKKIYFAWSVNPNIKNNGIDVTRPGGSTFPVSSLVSSTIPNSVDDINPENGVYKFVLHSLDANSRVHDCVTKIKVTLSEAQLPSDTGTTTPGVTDSMMNPPTRGGDCIKQCPDSGYFWQVNKQFTYAMCSSQCMLINWEAGIIAWAVGEILFPSLGLEKYIPQGYKSSSPSPTTP